MYVRPTYSTAARRLCHAVFGFLTVWGVCSCRHELSYWIKINLTNAAATYGHSDVKLWPVAGLCVLLLNNRT
jgi:hypothetical protein